jgi:Holliday junction resolvasome RuvABC endonuclease subunit
MRIAGIDVSTKTGIACIDDGAIYDSKLITFKAAKGFDRVRLIANAVKCTLEDWKPDLIVIEGYGFASLTLVCSVEIGTGIRLAIRELGHAGWYTITPSSLKLITSGKGNADKAAMAAAVKERWGFESKYDDVIDAYALCRVGEQIHSQAYKNLPKGVTHAI